MVSKRGRRRATGPLAGASPGIPQRGRPPKRSSSSASGGAGSSPKSNRLARETSVTAVTTTTATSTSTPECSNTTATMVDSAASTYVDAAALAAVKLETPDDDGDVVVSTSHRHGDKEDIKPNVQELQQQLMREAQQQHQHNHHQHQQYQQQHHQQQQLIQIGPAVIDCGTMLAHAGVAEASTSGPLTAGGKNNVFIIGDFMGNGMGGTVVSPMTGVMMAGAPPQGFSGPAGLVQAFAGMAAPAFNTAMPLPATAINRVAVASGLPEEVAAAIMRPGTDMGMGKLPQELFPKDSFDVQESDIDEDGCSDVDFDDDYEICEDDVDEDILDPQWITTPTSCRMVFKFERHPNEVGLEGRPKSKEPIFYFDKILGERKDFFGLLVDGSNRRAQELLLTTGILGQTYFQAITGSEMETFVGLCLQLSTMKLPTLADYWADQTHLGFKGFGSKMSLHRFQQIMRVWNFENLAGVIPSMMPGTAAAAGGEFASGENVFHQPLGDLRPLLDFFNQRMEQIYKCGQRLVLSEPILQWKGRMQWAREAADKFRQNALMLHLLTENSGLILKVVVNVNKEEYRTHDRNSKALTTQRIQLVMELLKEKLGKGHTLYASKYYSSYGLGYTLCNHQTYCTGFLDSKRYGNSKDLVLSKLDRNTFATRYGRSVMMGKWKRRAKSVYFYSSDCLAIYPKETYRSDNRPKIIKELEWQLELPANIGQYMMYYQTTLDRSEMKWDKQMAIYVFNLIMLNAYLLYTMSVQAGRTRGMPHGASEISELLSYGEFRNEVIQCLLKMQRPGCGGASGEQQPAEEANSMRPGPSGVAAEGGNECDTTVGPAASSLGSVEMSLAMAQNMFSAEHLPTLIPRHAGKIVKKGCRVCRKGGMRRMTKLCCEVCPGRPGLCDTPCFKIWHTQMRRRMQLGKVL